MPGGPPRYLESPTDTSHVQERKGNAMQLTARNTINGERMQIDTDGSKTVAAAVRDSGWVTGEFSVRDKNGNVIDDRPSSEYQGMVVNVGLPGRTVVGG
jgi:hypothetical protein